MDLEPNPKLFSDTKSLTKQLREANQQIVMLTRENNDLRSFCKGIATNIERMLK